MNKSDKLHIACEKGEFGIVKSLLEEKNDIEECDDNDQRPIHFACANGHVDIVKLLIENKCDIEACDKNDWRPIHIACDKGNVDIVKLLIGSKCNIESQDQNNWRPIHFASRFGSVPIVQLLIAYNCDTNAITKDNESPMRMAKQYNHSKLINLMKYGLFKGKLIVKINKASEVECSGRCKHLCCPKGFFVTDSRNKKLIDDGTYGKVYKLTNRKYKMSYVVKSIEIYDESANKEVKYLEDYINKNRHIIKHPGIVEYFGSFSYSKKIHIFMEFFPKGSLHDEIEKTNSLPHQRILRYTKQILEGVEFLHEKNVMHRNIKPRNILLDEDDCTKLCDFGTNKMLSSVSIRSVASTDNQKKNKGGQTKTYCGTANYMAPEVIDSYTGVGYSSLADIWSVGATIVHMLSGQPPYSGCRQPTVIFRIMTDKKIEYEPREPMSDNMKSFMNETLNPDPSKRATANELLQFLFDHNMT